MQDGGESVRESLQEAISVLNRCGSAFILLAVTGDKNCLELFNDICRAREGLEAALSRSGEPTEPPIQTNTKEPSMEWNSFEDNRNIGAWRVEANAYENEGAVYVAIFSGPDAQKRAEEYAALKNGQESHGLRKAS